MLYSIDQIHIGTYCFNCTYPILQIESTGAVPTVTEVAFNAADTTAVITLSEDLVQDQKYTIVISFLSQVNDLDDLAGLYRSFYIADDGSQRY